MKNGVSQTMLSNHPSDVQLSPNDKRPGAKMPTIQEQLGIDPISKLAAAIERLAAALEGNRD
jgi:hypothetical protein